MKLLTNKLGFCSEDEVDMWKIKHVSEKRARVLVLVEKERGRRHFKIRAKTKNAIKSQFNLTPLRAL